MTPSKKCISSVTKILLLLFLQDSVRADNGLLPRRPLSSPPLIAPKYSQAPGEDLELIVKFLDHLGIRASSDGHLASNASVDITKIGDTSQKLNLRFSQLVQIEPSKLEKLKKKIEDVSGRSQPELASLLRVHAEESTAENLYNIAKILQNSPEVEFVNLRPKFSPPPPSDIPPTTPSLTAHQDYRFQDPGMNIDYATSLGLTGAGVRLSDCEFAWNSTHEDLEDVDLHPESGQTPDEMALECEDHGTAVVGLIVAAKNSYGITGIAPDSLVYTYPEQTEEGGPRRAEAITNAVEDSVFGDIILLEMQTAEGGPAELDPEVWLIVRMAYDKGIAVVAAAGNGAIDLDDEHYQFYRDWGDSGAILVGAGTSNEAHNRIPSSTFGTRLDVHSWGENVFTLGGGSFAEYGGDRNQRYRAEFKNTSAASALVAGALALLQQEAKMLTQGIGFDPERLRRILERTGIPQGDPQEGAIGPFVDLKNAILNARVLNDDFAHKVFLKSSNGSVAGDNAHGTMEAGEPLHAGVPTKASVWWEWSAPSSGEVTFDTHGSDFDTILAIYTPIASNPDFSTIVEVASEDSPGTTESVTFQAIGNQTYQIAVASSVLDTGGDISLNWIQTQGTADLRLDVNDSLDPAPLGSEVMLTATVTNRGPDSATNLGFLIELPPELSFVSAAPLGACEHSGQEILCTFSSLGLLESQEVAITALTTGTGIVTTRVAVTAEEEHPTRRDTEAVESTTIEAPENLLSCLSFGLSPTISSTTTGGSWSNQETWNQARLPAPRDVVEIVGPVSLVGEPRVAGLLISQDGWLHEGTFSPKITIDGNLINHGQIVNKEPSRNFSLDVGGNIWNTGSITDSGAIVQIRSARCIANSGTWEQRETIFTGTGARSIAGNPLHGRVTVTGDMELVGGATLDGVLTLAADSRLEINAPDRLYVDTMEFSSTSSTLTGTGEMYLGALRGAMRGDLETVYFVDGGGILASSHIQMPRIIFSARDMVVGGAGSNPETITIDSFLTVLPSSTVKNRSSRDVTVVLTGPLENQGSISNGVTPNGPRRLTFEVSGPIDNSGTVQHAGSLDFVTYGNITNSGTWQPGVTELAGDTPRVIGGTVPLAGNVNASGSFELLGSADLDGSLVISGTVTINAPHILTATEVAHSGGWLTGTGSLHVSSVRGQLNGDLHEMRFVKNGNIRSSSTIAMPNIFFDASQSTLGGGGSSPETISITGNVAISPGATLRNVESRTVILNIDGSLTNAGTFTNGRVPNGPRGLTLKVAEAVENTGIIQEDGALFLETSGNITNDGTWSPTYTVLAGTAPRSIAGSNLLKGQVNALGDFELTGSVTLEELLISAEGAIRLQAPSLLTVRRLQSSGTLNGTGAIEVGPDGFVGSLTGDLAEVRFDGSAFIDGQLDVPSVVFSSGTSRIDEVVITGNASILNGATVTNWRQNQRGTLAVEGALVNEGSMTSRSDGTATFSIESKGSFENYGNILERADLFLAGDALNVGARTGLGRNLLTWEEVPDSPSYDISFSDNQVAWSVPERLSVPQYDVSGPLTSTFYWRTRAIDALGDPLPWSAIHSMNEDVVKLTQPSTPASYAAGSIEILRWTAPFPGDEEVILSMKRDSVPSDIEDPDGVNWIRLASATANDGIEEIVIPSGVAPASDWRFYVRHAGSGAFDGSDFNFTVTDPTADLAIAIDEVLVPVVAGEPVTYTVTVDNAGPSDAHGVAVTAMLPANVTLAATSGCVEDPVGAPTCSLGSIGRGSSQSYTLTVNVSSGATAELRSDACVSSAVADPDSANDCATEQTTIVQESDLKIELVDAPDPAPVGEEVVLTATVTNLGPSDASGINVSIVLPTALSFVDSAPPGGCSEVDGNVTCHVGQLASMSSSPLAIVARAETEGSFTTTASVLGSETDPESSNDSATTVTEIVATSNVVFIDGFESGNTQVWSATSP